MLYGTLKSLAITLFVATTLTSTVGADEKTPHPPTLTVRGIATISRPADELRLNIGVVTQNRTAENALNENNSKMNSIIKSLEQLGLGEGEFKTGRFNVRPLYSQRPKNAAPDWSPDIVGYEVTNSLAVKTEKIDLAGELIDNTTQSGANSVDNIRFGLKDPRKYRSEAIEAATRNALEDAKTLSNAAGVGLVRIKSLSLDDAQPIAPMPRGQLYAKSMAMESVPIEAGEVEIHASVTLQYVID